MVGKILRPRLWVLRRWVRESSPAVRAGMLVLLAALVAGGGWLYSKVVSALAIDQVAAVAAGMVPIWLFFLVIAALLGIGDILQRLFLSSDLELLMTAPVPLRTIYLVKLFECTRVLWLPASLVLVFLIALGHGQRAPAAFFPLAVLLVLASTLSVASVMAALVMLLVRIIPPQRLRVWIPAALGVVSVALALGQQSLLQQSVVWENWAVIAQAVLDTGRLAVATVVSCAAALVLALGGYLIFRRAFYYGWSSFAQAAVPRPSAATRRRKGAVRAGVGQVLSPQWRSLLLKEWHSLRRDPRQLINLVITPLIVIGFSVTMLKPEGPLGILMFWNVLFFAVLMGSSAVFHLGVAATVGEGRNVDLLRRLPVRMRTILAAKFWVSWMPAWLAWLPVLAVASLLTELTVLQVSILAGALALALAEVGSVGPAIGALAGDFAVEEETRRMPIPIQLLGILLPGVSVLLTGLSCALVVFTFFPSSELAATTEQALDVLPPVAWVAGGGVLPWLGLILGHAIFLLIVARLWNAGALRMERWEPA